MTEAAFEPNQTVEAHFALIKLGPHGWLKPGPRSPHVGCQIVLVQQSPTMAATWLQGEGSEGISTHWPNTEGTAPTPAWPLLGSAFNSRAPCYGCGVSSKMATARSKFLRCRPAVEMNSLSTDLIWYRIIQADDCRPGDLFHAAKPRPVCPKDVSLYIYLSLVVRRRWIRTMLTADFGLCHIEIYGYESLIKILWQHAWSSRAGELKLHAHFWNLLHMYIRTSSQRTFTYIRNHEGH